MKTTILGLLFIAMLMGSSFAKELEETDARSIAESVQAGSWSIYVIYFYWSGERENEKLEQGLQSDVVDKFPDSFYAKVDCAQSDYHQVLDLFEFQDARDNFKGRSIQLDELPLVLSIVHGVGYVSHGETSYELIAERMPELVDYSNRMSVQKAY
mmetsp:Transcript_3984/g.4618  ORF Transcript_3984/g.4618 Transcript_3984/m.4618 type:complete len:155 (+) Transcript_3984:37-501(+)